ncbi:hypothetical protein ACHAXA_010181 [Cyclostephanos tholiformis]|uniref:Secreted protein n=1 Tax=Cyclostephanos tholiformis TaxID=382380 RepID=A0ABD3R2D3_9STRA
MKAPISAATQCLAVVVASSFAPSALPATFLPPHPGHYHVGNRDAPPPPSSRRNSASSPITRFGEERRHRRRRRRRRRSSSTSTFPPSSLGIIAHRTGPTRLSLRRRRL